MKGKAAGHHRGAEMQEHTAPNAGASGAAGLTLLPAAALLLALLPLLLRRPLPLGRLALARCTARQCQAHTRGGRVGRRWKSGWACSGALMGKHAGRSLPARRTNLRLHQQNRSALALPKQPQAHPTLDAPPPYPLLLPAPPPRAAHCRAAPPLLAGWTCACGPGCLPSAAAGSVKGGREHGATRLEKGWKRQCMQPPQLLTTCRRHSLPPTCTHRPPRHPSLCRTSAHLFLRCRRCLLCEHSILLLFLILLLSRPVQEASCLPQARQHGAAYCVRVLSSGVLSGEQQAGTHLRGSGSCKGSSYVLASLLVST